MTTNSPYRAACYRIDPVNWISAQISELAKQAEQIMSSEGKSFNQPHLLILQDKATFLLMQLLGTNVPPEAYISLRRAFTEGGVNLFPEYSEKWLTDILYEIFQ